MIKVALKQKFLSHFLEIKIQYILPGTFIIFNVFLYTHDSLSRDHRFKLQHFQTAMCYTCTCICWLFATFFAVEPSITSDSGNQTKREGSDVTLFCDASGKPIPNVTWTMENSYDGKDLFIGSPWIIKNVSRNDTGTYRCTAYNGIGKQVNRLLYVNVTCKYKYALNR